MKHNSRRLMSGTISECTRNDRAKPRRTQKALCPHPSYNPEYREYKSQAIPTEPHCLINRTGMHKFSGSQRYV